MACMRFLSKIITIYFEKKLEFDVKTILSKINQLISYYILLIKLIAKCY